MELEEIIMWLSDRIETLKTEQHDKSYYLFLLQDILIRLLMVGVEAE